METETRKQMPILEIAWARFAQLDGSSVRRSKRYLRSRWWIGALGVLAVLFAILSQLFPRGSSGIIGYVFRVLLVATPLLASFIAYWVSKKFSGGDWLTKRAGAEEIRKEIYMFRTVLQKSPERRAWLEKRLTEILRQMSRSLSGELTMKPYKGSLPSVYYPDDPTSDPGFHDLGGDEYYRYRLQPQLAWHEKELVEYDTERDRLTLFIGLAGALGAILAAFDQTTMWVALTAAFTAAFISWQGLRNIDAIIRNYSKVKLELQFISDHWNNLEPEERTQSEFYKMVRSTEDILWSQNMEYIKSQQEALKESELDESTNIISRVIRESVESDARLKQSMADSVVDFTREAMVSSEEMAGEEHKAALTGLVEEASSEIVQAELAAMGQHLEETAREIAEKASSGFSSALQAIKDEFDGVEIGRDTPPAVLNQLLSRYPKSNDVKG